jgi:hypothetical protein
MMMMMMMMEAVRTSETSVDNRFTRQYNPEDSSEHHTRRRENFKSHIVSSPSSEMVTTQQHHSRNSHHCEKFMCQLFPLGNSHLNDERGPDFRFLCPLDVLKPSTEQPG